MEQSSNSKTYCPLLWVGLSNRDGGSLYPCCRFEYAPDQKNEFAAKVETGELVNNSFFQSCRKQALESQKVANCFKCYEDEVTKGTSDRTAALRDYPGHRNSTLSSESEIQFLELFIGRTCNLKCHTCNPSSSTKWSEDYQRLQWNWDLPQQKLKLADRIGSFPNLKVLKIIGGEPALSKKTAQALKLVSEKNQVSVEISTNCTQPLEADAIALFSSFKNVEISLSIDGFKEVNELIRHPSRWREVESTVLFYRSVAEKVSSVDLVLHVTVSALNVFSLPELCQWWGETFADSPARSRIRFATLYSPSYMNVNTLSRNQKMKVLEALPQDEKRYQSVRNSISFENENPDNLRELQVYCEKLDSLRGTDSKDILAHIRRH